MNRFFRFLVLMSFVAVSFHVLATEVPEYTVKVGETVKLEITSSARSILNRSTGKFGFWDVNQLELEVVSFSWDYAYVKGIKETTLSVVQLIVTHNHNGIYGDKYYLPFHVKVIGNGTSGGNNNNGGGGTPMTGGGSSSGSTGGGSSSTTVTPPALVSIGIKTELHLNKGESYQLTPTFNPINAQPTLKWISSDETVASVKNGLVKAQKAGMAIVEVLSDNGKYAFCWVYVNDPNSAPTSVTLSATSTSMKIGESTQLKATVYPSNATYTMSWQSSNSDVATVSANGIVTAKGPGTCAITATTNNGKSATCQITVTQVLIELDDANGVKEPLPSTTNLNYKREFLVGWNTVCVPFKMTSYMLQAQSQNLRMARIKELEIVGEKLVVVLETIESAEAGVPFLVFADKTATCTFQLKNVKLVSEAKNDGVLVGTFDKKVIGEGHYKIAQDGQSFGRTRSSEATVSAFRGYIDINRK